MPGIHFEDTMYLLNRLARLKPDYFYSSMDKWNRTSIRDKEDSQSLLKKYAEQQSEKLAQIALIGVGGIVQRSEAEAALEAGYDLIAVGKAEMGKEIKNIADINEQDQLYVPEPFWDIMEFMIRWKRLN